MDNLKGLKEALKRHMNPELLKTVHFGVWYSASYHWAPRQNTAGGYQPLEKLTATEIKMTSVSFVESRSA